MSKIILLSGFLGSGKTTFLKNILNDLSTGKIGVIVNEAGKVSIDGMLLQSEEVKTKELNNGSIFCACIKENFIQTLVEFKKYDIDYLLIEASGISDPSNLDRILDLVNSDEHYQYTGNICIVDGVYFRRLLKVYPVISRQLISADAVIINKAEQLSKEEIEEIRTVVDEYHPGIIKVVTSYCGVDSKELFRKIGKHVQVDGASSNSPKNKPTTFCGEYEGSITYDRFMKFIDAAKKESVRIKGFVKLDDVQYSVQVVNDDIIINAAAAQAGRDYEKTEKKELNQIVFISYQGIRYFSKILRLWNEYIDTPLSLR